MACTTHVHCVHHTTPCVYTCPLCSSHVYQLIRSANGDLSWFALLFHWYTLISLHYLIAYMEGIATTHTFVNIGDFAVSLWLCVVGLSIVTWPPSTSFSWLCLFHGNSNCGCGSGDSGCSKCGSCKVCAGKLDNWPGREQERERETERERQKERQRETEERLERDMSENCVGNAIC